MSKEKDRVVELKNKKFAFISIVLVVLFSLGYFGFQAFEEATYTYHSVEDLLSNEADEQNLNIGLKAMLVPNSYVRSVDGLSANFKVKDKSTNNSFEVNYSGEIGSVFFNEYSELVMQGYINQENVFVANNLSVRCPSKHQTEENTILNN